MIRVREILKLSLFKNFKILCGKPYLENSVTAAVILEYESSAIEYEGYDYGYFVLVSYFFAKTNPELVNGSIRKLIEKHVSGIALKIAPEEKLPDELIRLAEHYHVPIVTFYDEFMEDLIVCINESMRTRAQYIIDEERLNGLLTGTHTPDEVRATALDINPSFADHIICASLIPIGPTSNLLIHTYFDHLMYRKYQSINVPYSFVKSSLGLMLLFSFEESAIPDNINSYICDLLVKKHFEPNQFYIGISDEPLELSRLHVSVVKARNANIVGKYLGQPVLCYSQMGVYEYIMALVNNEMLYPDIEKKFATLREYDSHHESNLLETLTYYAQNNGDFAKTAKDCYQHANTIRYRIKKSAAILGLSPEHFDEELMLLIHSYLLHGVMTEHF